MKNVLIVLLIVLCSIWLLWIKLHQAGMIETATASTPDTSSNVISKPKTEREFYQALNRLIRVFESDLTLENLTPITTALNTDLPRTRLEDRYRLYTQLEQAIDAYTSQLNTEHADVLERSAALRLQLAQQLESAQQADAPQPPSDPNSSTNAAASTEATVTTTSDAVASPRAYGDSEPANIATQQATPPSRQSTQVAVAQQWPEFLKQGLSSKQQQLLDELAKQQIEIAYAGEGDFVFRLNPSYWVEHVAPHLPKADQVYFQQLAEQAQQPYAADASLLISWLQLGARAQVWGQYVQDYPAAHFVESAQANADRYLSVLLVGMDNTPTQQQGVLLPEVSAAYAQLMQQYPNSRLSKTLRLFEQQLAEQPEDVPAAARRAIALAKDQISR